VLEKTIAPYIKEEFPNPNCEFSLSGSLESSITHWAVGRHFLLDKTNVFATCEAEANITFMAVPITALNQGTT
jgi:hypothetical protein